MISTLLLLIFLYVKQVLYAAYAFKDRDVFVIRQF